MTNNFEGVSLLEGDFCMILNAFINSCVSTSKPAGLIMIVQIFSIPVWNIHVHVKITEVYI